MQEFEGILASGKASDVEDFFYAHLDTCCRVGHFPGSEVSRVFSQEK
jgi:hypothetical protein